MDLTKLRRLQDAVILTFPQSRADESRRAFNDLLREIIREEVHSKVVIDLGEVTWFSSLDLGGLVFALRECNDRGLRFCLACVGPRVRSVLEATKMDQVFSIHDSVEAAVAG
ncbi:MAG: STAS domain-containing protein [Candidatus Eisenbacteria bacterium]|uniref:STAS domain-containing protein n=1 Tax=Eiseniibacteriota bacterium TaxID=2212470 RepID=A0A956RNR3_UNCEI|nr:STAS domain-containing protein [Candidatus Eisenbacteria bacterium]